MTNPPPYPVDPQKIPELIAKEIEEQQRGPFRRLAAKAATAATLTPDKELQDFATKHPDRHAQSVAIYGRLAGYSEKLEVDSSLTVTLQHLSDAELLREVRQATLDYLRALTASERMALLGEIDAP